MFVLRLISSHSVLHRRVSCPRKAPGIVAFASERLQANRDLMARAIAIDATLALPYARGDEILADRDLIYSAIKQQFPSALSYAAESLKSDKYFVRQVTVELAPHTAVQHASESLRDDKDLMLECVQLAGVNLGAASERLRGDRELFEAARKSLGDDGMFADM
jgi:hypothetical protein